MATRLSYLLLILLNELRSVSMNGKVHVGWGISFLQLWCAVDFPRLHHEWFSIWGIYWEHLQCCWFSTGFSTGFSRKGRFRGSVAKLSRSDPLQSEDPRELKMLKLRLGWVDESFSPMENTWNKISILIAGWWFGTMGILWLSRNSWEWKIIPTVTHSLHHFSGWGRRKTTKWIAMFHMDSTDAMVMFRSISRLSVEDMKKITMFGRDWNYLVSGPKEKCLLRKFGNGPVGCLSDSSHY